jgi:hypothetical protein
VDLVQEQDVAVLHDVRQLEQRVGETGASSW